MRGGIVAVVMAGAGLTATADTAAGPDFQRDIQPILAEHCGHCHGVDEATRAGGLRLDLRAAALAGGDSGGPAIVPGKPAESELVRRVRAADPDEVMPPPSEKKPLSQRQIDLLERWIAAGAGYEAHWAFVPPTAPPVPAGAPHPVDAFVRGRLSREGLAPAPPAPEAALCRRLHLDLVGLPPSPEDLAAFARDGYEKTVERLLASPRYGEKWARQWLDLARYADSNGYEQDRPRQMWAWRDWVIGALNRDQPYDRFIVEQIAGDLLPGATQDQVIATGFLRNSMLNEEGAIIPEEFRMVEMFDRIDCVGKAVLGMSTQCAQCHTHKFDPLTQDEYYGMFAFLNNSYEARSPVHTPEQLGQIATVRRRLAEAEDTIRRQRPQWRADMEAWARGVAADLVAWTPLEAREMYSGGLLTHPVQLADKSILMLGHRDTKVFVEATGSLDGATGLQIEALNHGDLAMGGPARDEKWGLAELVVSVRPAEGGAWQRVKLADATADFSAAETREPAVDADGKPVKDTESVAGPVALLVDGSEHTSWVADRGDNRWNEPAVAVVRFEQPLEVKAGGQIKIQITMMGRRRYGADRRMIGCFRASVTNHPVPSAPPIDHAAILAIRTPAADRTERQERAIFAAWRRTVPEFSAVNAEIDALVASLPQAPTTVMHLAERPAADRRTTFLLDRGTWNKPLRPVEPHVPAALHAFPSGEPRNRLGFARWLVDRNSPLTARVAVNRIWQAIFGAGLVETPDDFGTRAPVPEHRGLLDWLAVDFMEHGWSQKHVLRRIVTSATYRQSSRATSDMLARDPRNVLLARGPRFRVDAEVVRDTALAIAGLLVERQGGPAVFPPVPENVLAFNFNKIDWAVPAAPAADRYRRSIYLFRRRSMPDPMLSTFDAPTGDISCARRPRSNTPLAALAGLNEPIFVEAARALARRALSEGGRDDASRVDHAFLLCTARRPRDEERNEMLGFLATQRRRLADGWLDVRTVATGAPEGTLDLPAGVTPQDAAAWTLAARVLLNLDETVTKN